MPRKKTSPTFFEKFKNFIIFVFLSIVCLVVFFIVLDIIFQDGMSSDNPFYFLAIIFSPAIVYVIKDVIKKKKSIVDLLSDDSWSSVIMFCCLTMILVLLLVPMLTDMSFFVGILPLSIMFGIRSSLRLYKGKDIKLFKSTVSKTALAFIFAFNITSRIVKKLKIDRHLKGKLLLSFLVGMGFSIIGFEIVAFIMIFIFEGNIHW